MTRGLRRLAQAALALVWASGTAWLMLHHWGQHAGAFGPEPSAGEPWALRVHGVAASATVALLGLLYGLHVRPGWRARRRRRSGGALFATGVALALSGDLLYYLADEDARAAVALAHWAVGLAALPLFVAHRWRRGDMRALPCGGVILSSSQDPPNRRSRRRRFKRTVDSETSSG